MSYLLHHAESYAKAASPGTIPLPRAVNKVLYVLCKIRGSKVVSRFLANDARLMEEMVGAFEKWSLIGMVWEERYMMLLWLGHLVLTPFDLESVGSVLPEQTCATGNVEEAFLEMDVPEALPLIAKRVLAASARYLGVAGKEREAAVTLMIRLALRPDMRKMGLLKALVNWAVLWLQGKTVKQIKEEQSISIYEHLGVLSFLASLVAAADTEVVKPFLLTIFTLLQTIITNQTKVHNEIVSSAMGRKLHVKVMRASTVAVLNVQSTEPATGSEDLFGTVLEDTIGYLLTALADKDTPVRYAASKALSVITVKLDPAMAAEVCEAVIASLEENVLWHDVVESSNGATPSSPTLESGNKKRDLSSVDSLKWHGLVLTLSHLLFRRCEPPSQLPAVLNALILALGFEQRSSTGYSTGTNIRDAACFGIWSLARRYSIKELAAIDTSTIRASGHYESSLSILQIMANELVVAGCLDPSGNIRRGASAALQELIGRHPDTVNSGINIVQVVDYHAVALRSRAIKEVSVNAAALGSLYWYALLDGLHGWRGIDAPDADSRRQAAEAIGLLSNVKHEGPSGFAIEQILKSLRRLRDREVEKRHGLLLAATAIVSGTAISSDPLSVASFAVAVAQMWELFASESFFMDDYLKIAALRPELTAEAACSLIAALATIHHQHSKRFDSPSPEILAKCLLIIDLSLNRGEEEVIEKASQAADAIFDLVNREVFDDLVRGWTSRLVSQQPGRTRGDGPLAALGSVYHRYKNEGSMQACILTTVLSCCDVDRKIETKVAALKCLENGVLPSRGMPRVIRFIAIY